MRRLAPLTALAFCLLYPSCEESPVGGGWELPKPGVSVCYRNCVRVSTPEHLVLDTLESFEPLSWQGTSNHSWMGRRIYSSLISKPYRYQKVTVQLWFNISADGRTTHVGLLSNSENPEIDRLVLEVLSYALWHPVTYDGVPVSVATSMYVPIN